MPAEVEIMKADLIKRFPEIPANTWDKYEGILEDGWESYFGGTYTRKNKEIILNLVAHLVTVGGLGQNQTARPVASQSVGSVSVGYQAPTGNSYFQEFFGSTKYGMHFIYLVGLRRTVAFV